MLHYVTRRLWEGAVTLAALVTLTFFFLRLAPGGPFDRSRKVSEAVQAQLLAKYNLDEPLWMQFARFVWGVVRFDLGPSLNYTGSSVNELILQSLPYSLLLGSLGMALTVLIGVPMGVLGALKRNSATDYATTTVAMLWIAIPIFVMGPVMQVFVGLRWGLLPVAGLEDGWRSLVLPVIVLALPGIAYISSITRTSMIEAMRENHVRTALSKGIGRRRTMWRHTLRGAMIPVIAYLGPTTAGMILGSVVVESMFALPGAGRLFEGAAESRDYPMVMGTTLIYGAMLIIATIIADVINAYLDPRLQNER